MKTAILALLLAGCSAARVSPGPGPEPTPLQPRFVLTANGTGSYQGFLGGVPATAFFNWTGNGRIDARVEASGIVIYAEGDSTWSVTPAAGLEADAEHAVQTGALVITRNGQRVGLSRPAPFVPPPAPAPKPISQARSLSSGEITIPICFGHDCDVPR